ncbi:MAG: hypothetical protein JNG90_01220, partial [Planctomycetaceae bacterium]|nr:hypothetical protein [Planctomycetaceae bacterium]
MSDHFPRALRELHQPFVHGLAARLAAAIRTPTDVRLTNVSSRTLWGLIEKLPDPTCLAVIASARFAEQALLEFSPAILFPLIDRLLG